jgi:hypothetical protein
VKPDYRLEANSRNVHTVRMDVPGKGWEAWFLLRSDVHHDHPHCDWALEQKHLDQAKERGAGVIDAGDLMDVMGGKWDKRSDKSGVRPEHQHGDYLDAVVRTAAEFYAPYAEHFVVIGRGNHETAILKRHETDLTERLCERIGTLSKTTVHSGGYGGWVRFLFTMQKTKRTSRVLHYYHGTGGGGPVTRGVIQTARLAVYTPDADYVLTGHTHDAWILPIARQRLSDCGVPYHDEVTYVRTPGYKDGWGDSYGGWEVEKSLGPKPRGAAWLRFYVEANELRSEVTRAT